MAERCLHFARLGPWRGLGEGDSAPLGLRLAVDLPNRLTVLDSVYNWPGEQLEDGRGRVFGGNELESRAGFENPLVVLVPAPPQPGCSGLSSSLRQGHQAGVCCT